ncbi:XTP/dITP diphosphatase [Agrilactobacillus fermenti]|uniref:XTP/dITP diphosphatase n=1 Tax=Agrilactobacillus fermenti TaxID=2586909 RepID=UPI001E2EABEC|nr:XTP/dITP diphosphatase [Agrilactobacillus fermenti]MCD2256788.1 XTP/dITP diphosphatase [Agrilactobacillus fermenti]
MSKLPKVVVIATKNMGKAREFAALFAEDGIETKSLLDFERVPEINENGTTFEANARIKADTVSAFLDLPVLADDSGLSVDYLYGQPGVHSARYAGDHNDAANNARLLAEMAGVPPEKRTAAFHSVLVFAKPDQPAQDLVVSGTIAGRIASFPRGENGFGYDVLFELPDLKKTMAEISASEKNKISHRAKAMAKLEQQWRQWWLAN